MIQKGYEGSADGYIVLKHDYHRWWSTKNWLLLLAALNKSPSSNCHDNSHYQSSSLIHCGWVAVLTVVLLLYLLILAVDSLINHEHKQWLDKDIPVIVNGLLWFIHGYSWSINLASDFTPVSIFPIIWDGCHSFQRGWNHRAEMIIINHYSYYQSL